MRGPNVALPHFWAGDCARRPDDTGRGTPPLMRLATRPDRRLDVPAIEDLTRA